MNSFTKQNRVIELLVITHSKASAEKSRGDQRKKKRKIAKKTEK